MSDITELSIPVCVCQQSLIGVGRERPCSWGNYFWTKIDSLPVRVLNMWAENLQAAEQRFLPDGLVKVRHYYSGDDKPQFCLVIDERIPADWRYDKLCFTGGYTPTLEQLRDMYAYLGDPTNELERFTDPKSYWTARGSKYDEKTGAVTTRLPLARTGTTITVLTPPGGVKVEGIPLVIGKTTEFVANEKGWERKE